MLAGISKNTLLNLVGLLLPLFVGLLAIPLLLQGLGLERFGVLALAWAVIGYFSFFDMGLGRALTQAVASRLGTEPAQRIARLAWTGLALMLVFSIIGASAVAALAPWLVQSVLRIPAELQAESSWAFFWMALAIPAVVLTAGLVGILTALQRFFLINALRIPLGVGMFGVPLLILPWSNDLGHICAGLLLLRLLFLLLHLLACCKAYPTLRHTLGFEREFAGGLLRFGGWLTVSNVIGPLMVYMDRFWIAAVLSLAAVAHYVAPYEVVTRLLLISAALVAVLFPVFASSQSAAERAGALKAYAFGVRVVLLALLPPILLLVLFAQAALQIWLGAEFGAQSAAVMQILLLGVFINSYAQVPFAYIQGVGRADITAKLHLLQLPLYLGLLYGLLQLYGIVGVAMAWSLRIALDALLLTWIAQRLNPELKQATRQVAPLLLCSLAVLLAALALESTPLKLLFGAAALLLLGLLAWRSAAASEQAAALRLLRRGAAAIKTR